MEARTYKRLITYAIAATGLRAKDTILFAFTFCFEHCIFERRLTLDLNHRVDFANLSKPVRTHGILLSIY